MPQVHESAALVGFCMPAADQLKPPPPPEAGAAFLGAGSSQAAHFVLSAPLLIMQTPHVHLSAAGFGGAMPTAPQLKPPVGGAAATGTLTVEGPALADEEAEGASRSNVGSEALSAALASRIACAWAADVGRGVAVELKTKVKIGRRCLSLRAASSCGSAEGAVKRGGVDVETEKAGDGAAGLGGVGAGAAGSNEKDFEAGAGEAVDVEADVLAKAGDSSVLKRSSVRLVGDSPSIVTSCVSVLTFGGGAKCTTGGGVDAQAGGAASAALTGVGCSSTGLALAGCSGSSSSMADGRFEAAGDGLAGGPSFDRTSCSIRSSAVTAFLRSPAGLDAAAAAVEAASLLERFVAATDRRGLRRGEGDAIAW